MKDYIATEQVAGVQFKHGEVEKIAAWCDGTVMFVVDENGGEIAPIIMFDSAGCNGFVTPGEWIVRDSDGDFFGYSDKDFRENYTIAGWHKE